MPVFVTNSYEGFDNLSPNFEVRLDDKTPYVGFNKDLINFDNNDSVAVTENAPVSFFNKSFVSSQMHSYSVDFFDRMHFIPSALDLGNLVSDQQRTIRVFSAYNETKTLQNIQETNTDGIELDQGALPRDFAPLEEVAYPITALTNGPGEINASLFFNFSGSEDDYTLPIVGQRIVNFPYQYSAGARETFEWYTSIIQSNNADEVRSRLRKNPRQFISVEYPIQKENMIDAQNLLYGWIQRQWAIPLWHESQLVGDILATDTAIPANTDYYDFRENGLVFVYDHQNSSIIEISTIDNGVVNLTRPIGTGFVNPVLAPVRIGIIKGSPTRKTNGYNGYLEIRYQVTENQAVDDSDSIQQYKDHDVYFDEFLIDGEYLNDDFEIKMDIVDYKTGDIAFRSPWDRPKIKRNKTVLLDTNEDIWEYRKFIQRRSGKFSAFWVPTFEADFIPAGSDLIVDSIIVQSNLYSQYSSLRNNIAIKQTNGAYLLREIVDTIQNPDNTETLLLDSAINIDYNDIDIISYLDLRRLDADSVDLRWGEGRVVQSTTSTVTL